MSDDAVSPPGLPYTFPVKGKYWYFRSKETGVIRIPGDPRDAAFRKRYDELCAQRETIQHGGKPEGTFAWLTNQYQKSVEYKALADSTQSDYAKTCELIDAELGGQPFALTTKKMIKAIRDDYAATPRKAHKLKQMLSRLYTWSAENEIVGEGFNPAAGIKRIKTKGGEREIVPWSDPEIEWALAAADQYIKTVILIAVYTGQRREDVVRMRWDQWQGDLIRVRTSKTRQLIDLPCHPVLRAHLEQLKASRGAIPFHTAPICVAANGKAWVTADAMSAALRRLVEKVDRMPNNRSMHGLRYAAAGRMEEGGATIAGIEAVLGHRTFRMAMKYASARLRAAGGIAAMKGGADG